MRMISHDPSDRRAALLTRAIGRSQRLVGMVCTHLLPQQEKMTLGRRRNRSPPPMNPADSCRLKKRVSSKRACLDFGPAPMSLSRKRSREHDCGESSRAVENVTEPGDEKEIRLEKTRSVKGAWKQSPSRLSKGLTPSSLHLKPREPRHGQSEYSVLKKMPVGFKMRRYTTEVDVLAVFKRNKRLPSAVRDEVLESARWLVVSLPHSAFIKRRHQANFIFIVEKMTFLKGTA